MAIVVFLPVLAMVGYMIYTQNQALKQHQALVAAVEVGDDVRTSSGIYGTIVGFDVDDPSIMRLEIAPDVVISMSRESVTEVAVVDDEVQEDDRGSDSDNSAEDG